MAENIQEVIIPYARSIPVQLTAEKLAPNRKHYIYINGVMCNFYVVDSTYDSGEINKIDIITAGTGYNTSTKINFIGANTRTAKATANVSNGSIIGIDLTDRGSGYKSNVYVTITGTGTNANAIPLTSFVRGTTITTNKYGKVIFTMYIPNDNNLKFPSGTLTFTISDHPTDPTLGTSVAVCTFLSNGKKQVLQPTPTYNYSDIKSTPQTQRILSNPSSDGVDGTIVYNGYPPIVVEPISPFPPTTDTTPTPTSTIPTLDPVTGYIIWTEPKNPGIRTISTSITMGKDNGKLWSSKVLSDNGATIDAYGRVSGSAQYELGGLPLYTGGKTIWDGIKDGTKNISMTIPLPAGTTVTQAQLDAMTFNVTNSSNGAESVKSLTKTIDPVSGNIILSFVAKETSDGYHEKYDVNYTFLTTTDVLNNPDNTLNIYRQQTVNGVPTGAIDKITYAAASVTPGIQSQLSGASQGTPITVTDQANVQNITNNKTTDVIASYDQVTSSIGNKILVPAGTAAIMGIFDVMNDGDTPYSPGTTTAVSVALNNTATGQIAPDLAKLTISTAIKNDTSTVPNMSKAALLDQVNSTIETISTIDMQNEALMANDPDNYNFS